MGIIIGLNLVLGYGCITLGQEHMSHLWYSWLPPQF